MHEINQCKLLAQEIKALRLKSKQSIKELAGISNVSESAIRKIETGNYNFNIKTLWKLCQAFKIRPCDLIKKANKRHP